MPIHPLRGPRAEPDFCPVCGYTHFVLLDDHWALMGYDRGTYRPTGEMHPVLGIMCLRCRHLMLFFEPLSETEWERVRENRASFAQSAARALPPRGGSSAEESGPGFWELLFALFKKPGD